MTTLEILKVTKEAKTDIAFASEETKNKALNCMAKALTDSADEILSANDKDVKAAKGKISDVMIDRLSLSKERIEKLKTTVAYHCGEGVSVVVKVVDKIVVPDSEKFRYVISKVKE